MTNDHYYMGEISIIIICTDAYQSTFSLAGRLGLKLAAMTLIFITFPQGSQSPFAKKQRFSAWYVVYFGITYTLIL